MEGIAEIVQLDKQITLSINSLFSQPTDFIWMVFSNKEIWFILYLAVAVFLYLRLGWKKATITVIAAVLCVIACDQGANLVKNFIQRLRPCNDSWMLANGIHIPYCTYGGFSFFSAHAANTAGFAVCSSLCFKMDRKFSYKPYTIAISCWAFLVGISRIFMGAHFFGDVMVGFIAGTAIGLILGLAARTVSKRLA